MARRKTVSGNCALCGTWRHSLHREHIVPRFKGGDDSPANIQRICANRHEDKTRADLKGWPLSLEHRGRIEGSMRLTETRARMSAAAKARVFSAETRARLSAAGRGRVLSEDHKQRISAALVGRPKSDQQKQKQRVVMLARAAALKGVA